MNKIIVTIFLSILLLGYALGQVTPIYDIQYTTDASGDSPLNGEIVTIEAIVTGESGAFGSSYFVQDTLGPWNGVMVYDSDHNARYGDKVRITATVSEYSGLTELGSVTEFMVLDSGYAIIPDTVMTGEIATDSSMAEAYESCLVTVENLTITNDDAGYGEWEVDDGSGACMIDNIGDYYFDPANYSTVKSITGLLNYSYGNTKIAPRLAWDIIEDGEFTRIQRIQQVRQSDLVRAFTDEESDTSYARGDTLTIKGIVTMPTGLSYAGAGIKFILSEPEGGPWSGILSYHPDSTAYPILYEGDLVKMTGYVDEYVTDAANMTEFWITSPIEILDVGQPLPDPSYVHTGDLRLPVDAEQWGNVMVYVKDATVVDYGGAYELFSLDDGSGSVLVDDDSDSLATYFEGNPLPPLGTIADSVRGWIYHHYGSYADTSTYKLEPLYVGDITWGSGPPSISNVRRDIPIPTASDAVTISADIATNATISEAAIYYDVMSGGVSSGYSQVLMSPGTGITFEGQIPAQAEGSFISYFITATDDIEQSTMAPSDTSIQNFSYKVTDGNLTIADVQYTPWYIADTPFEDSPVELTGILTSDTTANNIYEAYALQDAEDAWSGIFAFGINSDLFIGDEITIYGTATDYNSDYHYKWDNNTVILVDSFKTLSSGNTVNPITLTSEELATDGSTAEQYEGVLVKIEDATLISLNSYDASFDDGSGECLVDGDFMLSRDQDENSTFYINDTEGFLVAFGDTVYPGEKIDVIQGIFTYSFGTFKIEVRNMNDFGNVVGINKDFEAQPRSYNLAQNYPNPFNPETKIYFEIPKAQDVKIYVYNILGQKVRTLVNDNINAGRHVINWNGCNDLGVRLSSGVYVYRIKAGNFIASRKMIMMK